MREKLGSGVVSTLSKSSLLPVKDDLGGGGGHVGLVEDCFPLREGVG